MSIMRHQLKQTMFALLDNVIEEIKTRFNEKNNAIARTLMRSPPQFLELQMFNPYRIVAA